MLVQSFMSAVDLNIKEHEKAALELTLGMLETGKLKHLQYNEYAERTSIEFSGLFNMHDWTAPVECGTVACIGGTAELLGKFTFQKYTEGLENLFYPDVNLPLQNITIEQAAKALRNYLTLGKPYWNDALGLKEFN